MAARTNTTTGTTTTTTTTGRKRATTTDSTPVVDVAASVDSTPDAWADIIATVVTDDTATDDMRTAATYTVDSYRAADAATKATMRAVATRASRDGLRTRNYGAAGAFSDMSDAFVAASTPVVAAIPAYITIGDRIAALRYAADMLSVGTVVPDGIDADSVDYGMVNIHAAGYGDDMPDDIRSAARDIATTKITRRTDRRDIADVVTRAFDGLDSGAFLTVAEIRTRGTIPGDDYTPGDGAIAARLFPRGRGCTLTDVTPVDATGTTARGARKN